MKKIKKDNEPEALAEYKVANPNDDWKNGFKKNAGKQPNLDIKNALLTEQKGLCVYCEIDLKDGAGQALNDFRVEHFYPENPEEKDKRHDGINYALHWDNMFGCCTGGNSKSVVDKSDRYTNPDFSCDVEKGNHDWTNDLLNPLSDIPAYPLIFEFNEEGEISVSDSRCPEEIKDKASNTIRLLRLDSDRLNKFRKSIIDTLREQVLEVEQERGLDLALSEIASCHLSEDENGHYSAFFSTIRWYFLNESENILKGLSYDG
ncbi:TIGR02646 family protein [Vibrio alginolyticus]|uniref:retron Ec78 anti-phage system effector HNH endonuclease PtuB n=1 Tax=Vibrio harveyi group TaxID=717610 RepID=UPI00211AA62C|nr:MULTISPECIES: retron Ec78 anti-phage system effector HNH endonuclease PtuB [Vibrio harveyi group]MCG9620830.1 TIGR02646 family protein [Vibrio diabolicus]MCS0199316.1 TIGR02646 family protein [Vibrio alginolyticus]